MHVRERQVVETLVASRSHEQGEIVNALAQMHEDILAVAGRDGEPQARIVAGELRGGACDEAERRRLAGTYRHRPLEFVAAVRLHLRLYALGKIDKIVRAPFQDKSFLGQFNTARSPLEEPLAKFVLKGCELRGERGLRNVKPRGGLRDVAFLGNGDEVSEYSDVHARHYTTIRNKHQLWLYIENMYLLFLALWATMSAFSFSTHQDNSKGETK